MSAPDDWTQLPLSGAGRSLVEASAGTGKTWTIGVLYLRLLLEEGRMPRQIIVSTFTKAAAAELSQRLRGKLQWALAEAARFARCAGVDAPGGEEGADRAWLRGRWRGMPERLPDDVQRLQAALAEFDLAPISTLHALCSRILVEHPFAAGALFRARELIDAKTLETELVDDLWRVIAQGDVSDELVHLGRALKLKRSKPDKSPLLSRRDLEKYVPVLVQPNVVVTGPVSDALRERLGFLGDLNGWAERVRRLLEDDRWFYKTCVLRQVWHSLVDVLVPAEAPAAAERLELDSLRKATKLTAISGAGKKNPEILALADQSGAIVDALSALEWDLLTHRALRHFLAAAQRWCRQTLQARLDAANQSTFEQLLHAVHHALQARAGQRALADALFAAWPVALVDEFQDTDPVQFGILDAIYRDAEGAARGQLVMIGDPKQAIYRFRGGDVGAYERAKSKVPEEDRLTLVTNHRSTRAYVAAINTFYAGVGARLGPRESSTTIHYEAVKASLRQDTTPLLSAHSGESIGQPLILHELCSDEGIVDLEAHALRACAGQIVHALSDDGYRIGSRRLQPGDIAVLLPSHGQIARLSALLKARGIPCVVTSQKNVFETDTARELHLILHAVLHADDAGALRAALATRVWGASLSQVQQLRHEPVAWDEEVGRFHAMHAQLGSKGPLAVIETLLERQATRLLQTVEGERLLTDLRHLGELLQEAWVDCGAGERLMAWLADQIDGGAENSDAADARALRLESDAARVQLMTLHVSKGLEFGVVFLPLMWKHGGYSKGANLLSDGAGTARYLVEGPAKDVVGLEECEERHRILYVALTRATHVCHVFVLSPALHEAYKTRIKGKPPINTLGLSALWEQDAVKPSPIEHRIGWEQHPDASWSAGDTGVRQRVARSLPPAPHGPLPMRHSFTTLSAGGHAGTSEDDAAEDEFLTDALEQNGSELADRATHSAVAPLAMTSHSELDALSGVAGADFGNAVHLIFEHRVPQVSLLDQKEAVLAALHEHGVRPREGGVEDLVVPLARRLQSVLETALGGVGGPRLIELPAAQMRAEMEFNYALDGASLRALRRACEAHGERDLVPPHEHALAGLMNGKIDLLFAHEGRIHVLDYKSNRLPASGRPSTLEHYAPAALEQAMSQAGYRFQALLYAVAVERYLRERLGPDYQRARHLGDCWYLYIRAAGLTLPDGTRCGVWRHRFDDALLDAVQNVLATRSQEAA